MPSTKNPVVTVQPGPGRLPANTVPASALIFPSGGSSDAALQAHISDPVDAHMATAIGGGASVAWLDGTTNPAAPVETKIDKIISDLVANAAAARTGQAGYAGETFSIAAGSLNSALGRLFDGVNARAAWVLDDNPAATNADFAGPTALIDAMATVPSTSATQAILYLRPGTYDWDDSVDFSNCTVIGARRNEVIIQNLAGDLRSGGRGRFENLIIQVSGNVVVGGTGQSLFREVSLDATGDINVTSNRNIFEHIQGTTPQRFVISGNGNELRDYSNAQVQITGLRNVVDHGLITAVRSLTTPILELDGSAAHNHITNIHSSAINAFNAVCYECTSILSQANIMSNMVVDGFTAPAGNFRVLNLSGVLNSVTNLYLANVASTTLVTVNVAGSSNTVQNTTVLNFTNAGAAALVSVTGDGQQISNMLMSGCSLTGVTRSYFSAAADHSKYTSIWFTDNALISGHTVMTVGSDSSVFDGITFTSFTAPAGTFLNIAGECNSVTGVLLDDCGDLQAGAQLVLVGGTDNRVGQIKFNTIPSNTGGATAALLTLSGTNVNVDGVGFEQIGSGSALGIPCIRITSGSGSLKNAKADSTATTLDTGRFIDIVDVTDSFVIKNCVGRIHTLSTANAFHASSVIGNGYINVEDCIFMARGDGAATSSATVFVENSARLRFKNCMVMSDRGRAGAFANAGAVIDSCLFEGGTNNAGAGIQLFYGWGNTDNVTGTPAIDHTLTIRSTEMIYGPANCNPTLGTGNGTPIVFFGGRDDVAIADHGSCLVDGLMISAVSPAAVTAQHRDSLLVIDTFSEFSQQGSSYKDITIDLQNIPWSTSGAGRGTFATTAAVIEIEGSASPLGTHSRSTFENFRIFRAIEGAIADSRYMVHGQNCVIKHLLVDGPSVANGAGSFSGVPSLVFQDSIVYDLQLGRRPYKVSGQAYVHLFRAKLINGFVFNTHASSTPTALLLAEANSEANGVYFYADNSVPTTAMIHITSGTVQACRIDSDIQLSDPYVLIDSSATNVRIKNNMMDGEGSTGDTITITDGAESCHVEGNILDTTSSRNRITVSGTAGGGNQILGNQIGSDATAANCEITSAAERVTIANNTLQRSGGVPTITVSGARNIVTANMLDAGGGTINGTGSTESIVTDNQNANVINFDGTNIVTDNNP